jgi:galactokinase
LVAAPGRVNVIGEHTDYNGGYVLPMAIDRYVVIAAAPRGDVAEVDGATARVYSADLEEEASIRLAPPMQPGSVSWANYVQGVVAGCASLGWALPKMDALILSSVPVGGGLSSSAALEVATATLLETVTGSSLDPIAKALLCQKAEHDYAGVPCGIMDQFSSVLGRENALMLLDCRSQQVEQVPFADPDVTVVIANSNVKHELTGGEYAQRRQECERAAEVLGVPLLRDAGVEQLAAARDRMDDVTFRRARHVIGEIGRTVSAAEAIRAGNWRTVGELMYASHESLRDDYEVSCEELDLLVEIARSVGFASGLIGSRMTGGGFGGCTVSLVRTGIAADFAQQLHRTYSDRTGIEPSIFATRPTQGAMVLRG